jgi:hypothetical protein
MTHFSTPLMALSAIAAALLMSTSAQAGTLTKAEMDSQKAQIDRTHDSDKSACGRLANNAKDVCLEEAMARQKVGHAELVYRDSNAIADFRKLSTVQAETAYAVAKEKCDDRSGNAKDVCVQEAKAVETKALADVKLAHAMGVARYDATAEKREANHKVAVEKCDAMAGDAKTKCLDSANAMYGKR